LHISKHDLEVLSKIDNFSAPKHPFKEDIKSLLGRDINISNAFDLFPVLCTEEDLLKGNILKNRTPSLMLYGREIRTISLIYTLLNLFFYTLKKNKKNISDLNVGFFIKSNSVSSVLLPVLFYPLIKIFAFKGLRLNISNHLRMEARAYFTLLNSYTAMIVPGRGGVSSFLQFIKLGGTVLCKEGTKNSDMLDHEGVEYIKYNRVSDAIDVLFNSVVHKGSADLLISSQKNKETFDKVKKYNSFFFNRLYGDKDISFSECIKDAQINSKQ